MGLNETIEYFGSKVGFAAAMNISPPAVTAIVKKGEINELMQYKIHHLSNGKLQVDSEVLCRDKTLVTSSLTKKTIKQM